MREIKLTDQQVQTVIVGLAELPYRVSAPVIQAIQQQVIAAAKSAADANGEKAQS